MNGMYEELIEKLRKNNRMSGWTHIDRLIDEAAEAIEALQQENEQLQELAKAKADGRLVVLPVKVGDTVYIAAKEWDARYCLKSSFVPCVREGTVAHICISHKGIIVCVTVKGEYSEYYDFGKTVFLTREEAEKALEVEEWKHFCPEYQESEGKEG